MIKKIILKKVFAKLLLADFLNRELPEKLKDELSFLYEVEYKRHALKSKGADKKIINLIEGKAKTVGMSVAKKLKAVYQEWLNTHSFKDPEKWAMDRLKHNGSSPEEVEKEFKYWTKTNFWKADNFVNLEKMPYFNKWLKAMSKDDPQKALKYVFRFPFKGAMQLLEKYESIPLERVLLEFYAAVVFPEWKKYWKKEGLEKTYNRLEKTYEDLRGIHLDDASKMFTTINRALNETHQTGEMMEYVEKGFGVSKADLDAFSNADVKKWDREVEKLLPEPS